MLRMSYTNQEEIPSGLAEYYAEDSGVYTLKVEGIDNAKSVEAALQKERAARREAEKRAKDFETKYGLLPEDFNIDEYNSLKDTTAGKIDEKLKEQRERITAQHKKEMEALQSQLAEKENLVNTHVKSATLQRAMVEAGIAKPFTNAVEAMMSPRIKVEGTEVYLDEKPVAEALKTWAQSDEGKHYVAAATNTGGGTNTAKGGVAAAKEIKRADFDALSHAERATVVKEGAKVIE